MRNISILQSCCSVLCFSIFSFLPNAATASDTITTTQPLRTGQTIISASKLFELGFFSPNNSSKLYLGIWYKQSPNRKVVWVANRDNPITNSSAVLQIGENGNIILIEGASTPLWSSNQTSSIKPVAQILDSGNFVVRLEDDSNPSNFLWQSFDYPTDTSLPGLKLGWDSKSGLNRYLNSWKTSDDPSSGDYSFNFNLNGYPEFFMWNKQVITYRIGPWNGVRFSGVPATNTTDFLIFSFIVNPTEVTYSFELVNQSDSSQLVVTPSGLLDRYAWIDSIQTWSLFWFTPLDQCDSYRLCGPYGVCNINAAPYCQCLQGFEPKNPKAWALRDGSGGCVRVAQLGCGGDGFLGLKSMKLPETAAAVANGSMSLVECEQVCLMNCSCTAYSNLDIKGDGSGCLVWFGDLMDMRLFAAGVGGQDLFVRVAASDIGSIGSQNSSNKSEEIQIIVGLTVGVGAVLLGFFICFVWKRKRIQRALKEKIESKRSFERSQGTLISGGIVASNRHYTTDNPTDELELLFIDFGTIVKATNNFSEENKLGEGGFGSVYKGTLAKGQEIAVKRLSKYSGQGTEEFKNEIKLIARVQHRNLVRLLGCCIEKEEKMVVYEYMENKSLDSILFDKMKCSMLNWQMRFNIIRGIARGLLYLHQDSRFRIIHRDLKASNVLLDGEMIPKISDFGMARIFGGDQTEANTERVVGTLGYMSPEYAMDGLFSVKSDVFSFGVLLLEIISGNKNRGFYNTNQELNLLGHAWWLWKEGNGTELLDPSAGELYSPSDVIRCIQVALLCVQERAEDRPDMSSVLLMLSSSEAASMSQPKLPGMRIGRKQLENVSSFSKQDESDTVNGVTVTILDGR